MKKLLLSLMVLSGLAINSFAQSSKNGNKFSIGFEAGLPVGDVSNVSSVALGGSLKYDIALSNAAAFTLSGGYTSFVGKTVTIAGVSYKVKSGGFVPLKAGLKYYFVDYFYGEAQFGAVIGTNNGGGTAFVYSPGVGYKLSENVDLGIRYEGWSKNGTISQMAARLAVSF